MDLARLECFIAVAEELHFARAAERVHLTVSPVSRAIKELEHDLGGQLFVRSYHRVELTPFGAELLPLARQVIEDVEVLQNRARKSSGATRTAVFRIGVSQLCPPLAAEHVEALITRSLPRVKVELAFASAAQLLPQVERGELSLALVQLPTGHPRLTTKVLARLTTWVIMRKDDALVENQTLRLEQLAGRTLTIGSPHVEPVAMETMIANLKAHGVTDIVQLPEFDHVKLAAQIRFRGGIALTLHPRTGGSARIFDDEAFQLRPLNDLDFRFPLGAAWRTAAVDTDPLLRRVVELLDTGWVPPELD